MRDSSSQVKMDGQGVVAKATAIRYGYLFGRKVPRGLATMGFETMRFVLGAVCIGAFLMVLASDGGPPAAGVQANPKVGEDEKRTAAAKRPAALSAAANKKPGSAAAKPTAKKPTRLAPSFAEVSSTGEVLWSTSKLARPTAVDVDDRGWRLVADRHRHRVYVFDQHGEKVKEIPVGAPTDADFLPNGGYLVVSGRDKTVVELDSAGKEVWRYAELKGPRDADRLANGNTMIADTKPGRLIEIDASGEIVWSHKDRMKLPVDVEIGVDGHIYFADYNGHSITCVRRDGRTCGRVNELGHPSSLQLLDDGSFVASTHKAGSLVWISTARGVLGNWFVGPDLEDFALRPAARSVLLGQRLRDGGAIGEIATARALDRIYAGIPLRAPNPPVEIVDGVDTTGKNLVLILFDSLRKDHVSWHGYWRRTTPVLDRLARKSLVLDQYITAAPWTKPSVASLLTSTHPPVHGAIKQTPDSQLPVSLETMAETLQAAGYYTAGVMQNPHMGDRNSSKGFEQGFDRYEYVRGKKKKKRTGPRGVTDTGLEVLSQRPKDRPFFLTMFYFNPHYPYEPAHRSYGDRAAGPANPGPVNEYDGEIREADLALRRLLDGLVEQGVWDDTIVVFSSDHGEELGDHRNRFHGDTMYDCVLNVPMLISGIDRRGWFPGLVRQVDVMPTLLDYLGVEPSPALREQMAGQSVRPFLEPGVERTGLVAYSHSRFRDNVHLISERSESRKLIVDLIKNTASSFDMQGDPQEYDNRFEGDPKQWVERLRRWQNGLEVAEADAGPTEAVPEEVLERLRAAGYLGDSH